MSPRLEQSANPEARPQNFQAVIVLGKNWRERPPKDATPDWKPRLSIESEMSALAAGQMYRDGKTTRLIFTGGRTAGGDRASEAEAMRDYLKKKFPEIPEGAIEIESESIDTFANAEGVSSLLQSHGLDNVALLTVGFHLSRADRIFKSKGIKAECFSSEEIMRARSKHHDKLVDRFHGSGRVKWAKVMEFAAKRLLDLDSEGDAVGALAKLVRGDGKKKLQ